MESRWKTDGDVLVYRISANSFLYGMVRAVVGTMVEVADKSRELSSFEALLLGGERREAGASAGAKGLTLVGVGYDLKLSAISRQPSGNTGEEIL